MFSRGGYYFHLKMSKVLFLRFVSPGEICESIAEGAFDDVRLENLQKFNVEANELLTEEYKRVSKDPRFSIRTRSGVVLNVYCAEVKPGLRCRRCGSDIPEGVIPASIPTRVGKHHVKLETGGTAPVNAYFCEKSFCDFNCALGFLVDSPHKFPHNAEHLLRSLHKKIYPESERLEPAKDPDLLKIHGGTLSYSEYKKDRNEVYRPMRGFIVNSDKRCYTMY